MPTRENGLIYKIQLKDLDGDAHYQGPDALIEIYNWDRQDLRSAGCDAPADHFDCAIEICTSGVSGQPETKVWVKQMARMGDPFWEHKWPDE